MSRNRALSGYGVRLLVLASLAAFGIALFNYFWLGNGIHGTAGALLVVVSSALMLLAALALTIWPGMARWLRGLLLVLILLDIAGTGFAAYMLEAYGLIAAVAVALIFSIGHIAAGPGPRTFAAVAPAS